MLSWFYLFVLFIRRRPVASVYGNRVKAITTLNLPRAATSLLKDSVSTTGMDLSSGFGSLYCYLRATYPLFGIGQVFKVLNCKGSIRFGFLVGFVH